MEDEEEEWAPGAAQDPISRGFTILLTIHSLVLGEKPNKGSMARQNLLALSSHLPYAPVCKFSISKNHEHEANWLIYFPSLCFFYFYFW